jgi:serine/threonine protein phosphatase PrpC
MNIAVGTNVKTRAPNNVDAYSCETLAPGIALLVLAEGFGRVRGRPATEVAVLEVRNALRRRVRSDGRNAKAALLAAFSRANANVFARSGTSYDFVAAAASISAALLVGGRAHIAHIGATSVYLSRNQSLLALGDDGLSTGGQTSTRTSTLRTEPLAGYVLMYALGAQSTIEPTYASTQLMHGDSLVLTTSAFHKAITDEAISYALQTTESSRSAVRQLLAVCNMEDSDCDATFIIGRSLTEPITAKDAELSGNVSVGAIALTLMVLGSVIGAMVFYFYLGT